MPTHQTKTGKGVSEGAKKAAVQYLDASSLTQECGWRQQQYEELLPYIQQAIDAQLANARNDAIEECAKECAEVISDYDDERPILACIRRIRALKKGPNHV